MSDEKTEKTKTEKSSVVEKHEEVVEKKPKTQPKEKAVARMSLEQFFKSEDMEIGKYIRAYFQSEYRGILKGKEEWKKELDGKL